MPDFVLQSVAGCAQRPVAWCIMDKRGLCRAAEVPPLPGIQGEQAKGTRFRCTEPGETFPAVGDVDGTSRATPQQPYLDSRFLMTYARSIRTAKVIIGVSELQEDAFSASLSLHGQTRRRTTTTRSNRQRRSVCVWSKTKAKVTRCSGLELRSYAACLQAQAQSFSQGPPPQPHLVMKG